MLPYAAVMLLGALSVVEARLAVFSLLLHVIALATTTRLVHVRKVFVVRSLWLTGALSLAGMTRFILFDALPGIIEARGRDTSSRAVSLLREILFAEDAMRRYAFADPDGDHIGSAGLLAELTGSGGLRGGPRLSTPPLSSRYAPAVATVTGPALDLDGYLYLVCLPGPDGAWAADSQQPVDDELAERRWVAYAWPSAAGVSHRTAYFIDEHETILESAHDPKGAPLWVGPGRAPACAEALVNPTHWTPWRKKRPRPDLPGERLEERDHLSR